MPLLLSYGTLREEDMLRSAFVTLPQGQRDELLGDEPSNLRSRRRAGLAVAASLCFLTWACSGERPVGIPSDQARVEAELALYSELVLAMDHAGIAALFAPEGEIVNPGQAPVHGRAAIEAFLSGFSGYRVLSNSVVPSSTQVTGEQAVQVGQYRQRVRTPDGKVLEVSGSFRAEWVRNGSHQWLIQRMSTTPGGESGSGS